MSSTDRLEVLRKRNKDLLNQLKRQSETLVRLSGCSHSHKREREDEAGEETVPEPAEVLTLTGGDRGPARTALARPSVRFADGLEGQSGIQKTFPPQSMTPEGRERTAEHTKPSDLFSSSDRHHRVSSSLQDVRPANSKSCLVNSRKEQENVQSRVTFQSDGCDEASASDRYRHVQPLLGYDWIAGVLDAEDSLIERPDDFFNDLRAFRSLNKDDCVHSPQAEFSEENHSVLPLLRGKDSPEDKTDSHQCTFSYRINSRLFPVPLHSHECCPVCKKLKSSHPHTAAEPALVRVSIPRSTLLPPYKYKAHRRCSFDPSDSLGLPRHCLSGWSNKGQSTLPPPSSLDLRSSLRTRNSAGSQNNELKDPSAPKGTSNQISDQIPDVSRLARHNFQHFSPKRKLGSASYTFHLNN